MGKNNSKRKEAMSWWNNMFARGRFKILIKHAKEITAVQARDPDTLTGSEIEELYNKEFFDK